jgi:Porin PorA
MRRVVGLTLTGLGAFFVAAALLLRFYVADQVIKFPLNEYVVLTFTGNGLSYFSVAQLKEVSGVSMRATSTFKGDVKAGSSSTAVWDNFTALEDVTNHQPVQYSSQRAAFDRRTGALGNCCGAAVDSNKKVRQSGLAFVWPIGAQKQTYHVFDTTLLKPAPARYAGTTAVDGMTAYKFVEQVSHQPFGQQVVPRALAGLPGQGSVTLTEYYTATNTYRVDPVTGTVLAVSQNDRVALEDSTGTARLVALQGQVATTPQSNKAEVDTARSAQNKIKLIQDIGPLVLFLLGVALIVVGIVLVVRQRDDEEPVYDQDPVGSAA